MMDEFDRAYDDMLRRYAKRAAMRTLYENGFSLRQIAMVLDVSHTTVWSTVNIALTEDRMRE
jgi:transposase-like protein